MNNDIEFRLNKVGEDILYFREKPISEMDNANLLEGFSILREINIHNTKATLSEFKLYRLKMLKFHIEIVELFEQYYIEDYKPNKMYRMNIAPPEGSVDGFAFGTVDPSMIKDKAIREKYRTELEENYKVGVEMAFHGELTKLKYALEIPDKNVGYIASIELFIKDNYLFNFDDEIEIKKNIYDSKLKDKTKNKIVNDIFR